MARFGSDRVASDPTILSLRTVHRAAADLRRGTPVLLTGDKPLVLLAAETAGPRGLAEFGSLAAQAPVLLLAPIRAAAVLHSPVEPGRPVVALALGGDCWRWRRCGAWPTRPWNSSCRSSPSPPKRLHWPLPR